MEQHINDMTREQIENCPVRNWDEDVGPFDYLIMLPMEDIHDSGYRCMDFVAVKENLPIARLSGCSDVIHISGIGGLGKRPRTEKNLFPREVLPVAWSIDCLKTSGLLRLFNYNQITAGSALSSFEVFEEGKKNQ